MDFMYRGICKLYPQKKILKKVTFLILILLITNNVQAQSNYCYCTNNYTYNQQFGGYACTANADCWACASGAYFQTWQQAFCPSYQNTCTPETQTQTLSCPVNYSGAITQTRTKVCPTGVWTDWITTSTCTPNPPSCQISTQTQTLSCQEGYVGAINQTRTSSCPNPYGQPVWGSWLTSSNTCVKSVTNVTNVLSPISPISPTNPTSVTNQSISTPAPTTQSAPATVQTNVQTTPTTTETQSQTETGGSVAPQTASPATSAPAPTVAPKSETKQTGNTANSPKANSVQTAVGNLIKFEIITQSGIKQPDLFPIIDIGQSIPDSIRRNQDLYFQFIQGDTVDFGGEQDIRMNAIKQFTLEYENGFE